MNKMLLNDIKKRRRTRELLTDPYTINILKHIKIQKKMLCLEVGAGYGSIAKWLCSRVGNSGKVIATDIKDHYIEKLKSIKRKNLSVLYHDIKTDSFPNCYFDLIHARFVLEHIPERVKIIKKLVNYLKIGGWLIIEDADFSSIRMNTNSGYRKAMICYEELLSIDGSSFSWTKELPYIFSKNGLTKIKCNCNFSYFKGNSIEAGFWASSIHQVFEKNIKIVPGKKYSKILNNAIEELSDVNNWFVDPIVVSIIGQKNKNEIFYN